MKIPLFFFLISVKLVEMKMKIIHKNIIYVLFFVLQFWTSQSEPLRRALITGVSKGIGHALAKNLLKRGIHVLGISRSAASAIPDLVSYPSFSYISLDLTKDSDLLALKKHITDNNYTIDFLVLNAAMIPEPCTLEKTPLEDMEKALSLNLLVPMKMSNILSSLYSDTSRILIITSRVANEAIAQVGPYCISKAGLNMFTRILKKELSERTIAVASAIPGEVDTSMQEVLRNASDFSLKDDFVQNYKNEKLIAPEVCAQFLSWLLCDIAFDDFKSKEEPWNIYDVTRHKQWLNGSLPECPW